MPPTLAAAQVTNTYRGGLIAVRARLLAHLTGLWRQQIDPADIRGSVTRFIGSAVVLTTAAQRIVAHAGPAYVAAYVTAATGDAVLPQQIDVEPLVGRVKDGRALGDVLPFLVPSILGNIGRGQEVTQALDSGLYATGRLCGSETLRASRDGLNGALIAEPRTSGRYRRVLSGRPCPLCIQWASQGDVFNAETAGFAEHVHCSCTAEPAVEDVPDRFPRSIPDGT